MGLFQKKRGGKERGGKRKRGERKRGGWQNSMIHAKIKVTREIYCSLNFIANITLIHYLFPALLEGQITSVVTSLVWVQFSA